MSQRWEAERPSGLEMAPELLVHCIFLREASVIALKVEFKFEQGSRNEDLR
jgi:hypothetical protein